jgi:DNA-binding protein H-NS
MSYQELLSKKAALEKEAAALQEQIDSAQRAERAQILDQIKTLMAQYGITAADLGGSAGGSRGKRSSSKSAQAGSKLPVKYRDSAGNTWTGRGLQPKWLKAALADGRKLEEFLVS